jgi:hypothetical protein
VCSNSYVCVVPNPFDTYLSFFSQISLVPSVSTTPSDDTDAVIVAADALSLRRFVAMAPFTVRHVALLRLFVLFVG